MIDTPFADLTTSMYDSDNKRLTFWGASPIIFALTIVFVVLLFIIDHFYGFVFEIDYTTYRNSTSQLFLLLWKNKK